MDQDAIRAQLDRLRAGFAAELPQRLAQADALLAALAGRRRRGPDGAADDRPPPAWHRRHHGFAALSDAAAALEATLDACLKAGAAGPEDVAAIAAGLAGVKAAA